MPVSTALMTAKAMKMLLEIEAVTKKLTARMAATHSMTYALTLKTIGVVARFRKPRIRLWITSDRPAVRSEYGRTIMATLEKGASGAGAGRSTVPSW
jgi:hypothetical protein